MKYYVQPCWKDYGGGWIQWIELIMSPTQQELDLHEVIWVYVSACILYVYNVCIWGHNEIQVLAHCGFSVSLPGILMLQPSATRAFLRSLNKVAYLYAKSLRAANIVMTWFIVFADSQGIFCIKKSLRTKQNLILPFRAGCQGTADSFCVH